MLDRKKTAKYLKMHRFHLRLSRSMSLSNHGCFLNLVKAKRWWKGLRRVFTPDSARRLHPWLPTNDAIKSFAMSSFPRPFLQEYDAHFHLKACPLSQHMGDLVTSRVGLAMLISFRIWITFIFSTLRRVWWKELGGLLYPWYYPTLLVGGIKLLLSYVSYHI